MLTLPRLTLPRLLGASLPGLEVLAVRRGLSPQVLSDGGLLASRGAQLVRLTAESEACPAHSAHSAHSAQRDNETVMPGPPVARRDRRLAAVPWLGPALRLGVHIARELPDGAMLAITSGVCWRGEPVEAAGGLGYDPSHHTTTLRWRPTLHFAGFRKPARRGVLVEGRRVWLAQYDLNRDRSRVIRLWYSDDAARSFDEIYRFEAGDIRHIHFIQRDPIDGKLWMGTGDTDAESGLFCSDDAGHSWQEIGRGSQRYRAIALAFTADGIYWGTDAGSDAGHYRNRILRLDRRTQTIEDEHWLQGPVHGVCATKSGQVLVMTGLEGGVNEHDRRVHLWQGGDDTPWREIASFSRGLQPRRLQYAVGHFAVGQDQSDTIWLGLRGVLAGDVLTLTARLRS